MLTDEGSLTGESGGEPRGEFVAGAGGQTGHRRQGDDRVHHDLSSLSGVASGIPSRAATFFWISMIASACSNLRPSRAFSRLACASSAAKGFRAADLGPRLAGRQCTKSSTVALSAPVRQGRRIQAFPAQDSSDPTNFGRDISLRQNTQLRLHRKSPTPRPIRQFGRRRRRGRHCGRPPASLRTSPGGTVRFRFFVLHDHVMVVLRPQG